MKCPSCDARVDGKRCACGYQHKSVTPTLRNRCAWTREERSCGMRATSGDLCGWHRYWLGLIEHGAPGRTEQEEFHDWWEQFQPYGVRGGNPGQWWASVDVLWSALRGFSPAPLMTDLIDRELFVRRSEVDRWRRGITAPCNAPWARLSGPPLPPWSAEEWRPRVQRMAGVGVSV